MLRTATATGSDVISFDAPLCPLPEVGSSEVDVAQQPEVEFFESVIRHRVREFKSEEGMAQTRFTRRSVTTLALFSVVIFVYLLLTSLTQSLTSLTQLLTSPTQSLTSLTQLLTSLTQSLTSLTQLLIFLTQSLTCQRTGVLVLIVWVTWLLPVALIWISDIQSRLRCVCHCHVTCWRDKSI